MASPAADPPADDSLLLVPEDELDAVWLPDPKGKFRAPTLPSSAAQQGWACAAVGFAIESDGNTTGHRVLFE